MYDIITERHYEKEKKNQTCECHSSKEYIMNEHLLENSTLFKGLSSSEVRAILEETPHHVQCYDKSETIFHLMDEAARIGIVLEGCVQAQKSFANGSQVNVTSRFPGQMLGPAAAFSENRVYPCDVIALQPSTIMMFQREDMLRMMQKNLRVLQNFTTEISSSTYLLQQRLELFSYNGIAQRAAFWLLTQSRKSGQLTVALPESVTRWAMLMNVSRPSLHRELRRMETEGLIRYTLHRIEILTPDGLEALLGT